MLPSAFENAHCLVTETLVGWRREQRENVIKHFEVLHSGKWETHVEKPATATRTARLAARL